MVSTNLSRVLWLTAILAAFSLMVAFMAAAPASAQTEADGDVTVSAENQSTLTLDISDAAVDFGTVAPNGSTSSSGAAATTNSGGAFYSISDATTVTVNSNQAWTGNVSALAPAVGEGNSDIPLSALQWQLGGMAADGAGATSFSETADTSVFETSSSGTALGTGESTYAFGYGLGVLFTNTPGAFATTVNYSASQSA